MRNNYNSALQYHARVQGEQNERGGVGLNTTIHGLEEKFKRRIRIEKNVK